MSLLTISDGTSLPEQVRAFGFHFSKDFDRHLDVSAIWFVPIDYPEQVTPYTFCFPFLWDCAMQDAYSYFMDPQFSDYTWRE
jgi:hypothetical protein